MTQASLNEIVAEGIAEFDSQMTFQTTVKQADELALDTQVVICEKYEIDPDSDEAESILTDLFAHAADFRPGEW